MWRPLLAGEAFFWGTPLLQFAPWQRMAAEMWRAGHWPLWNPLLGCGAPLAANYQTGAFYPLNLLYLLLPVEVAMVWTAALHLTLAGWGMYRWGRAVGLDEFPAALGGLAFAGGGFLVSRLALFPSMVVTFPWLSVWLWRGEMLVQRARPRDALGLGMSLGLGLLAGHAQTACYGGILLAAYVVFRAWRAGSREQEARSKKQEAIADDRVAIADDRVAIADDRVATADDRVATADDRVAIADDRVATADDQVATADDQVAIGDDRVATADDRVAIADDRVAIADDRVAIADDRVTATRWGRSPNATRWLLLFLAAAMGVGLAAVQLLPTAELMLASQRAGGVDYDFAMTYSLWPWRLISFAAPDFFGSPGRGDYWGYPNYWEGAGYIGLLPLLLALGLIFRKRGQGDKETRGQGDKGILPTPYSLLPNSYSLARFWAICAAVSLILALGKNTPVFPFLFRHVPGFDWFQAPARWLAVVTTALAALAALGAQGWPAGRREQRLGALGVALGAALLMGGLAAPRIVPGIPTTFAPATARLGGTLAVAGALTLLRRRMARRANWWQAAVGVFVALDLLLAGRPLIPTVDRALYQGRTEAAAALGDAARIYWPTDPAAPNSDFGAEYRVKFSYLDFAAFGPREAEYWRGMREALLPNVGMLDNVASANNFDSLLIGQYVDMLNAVVEHPSLLRVMGVTHVVSDRPWPDGEPLSAHYAPSTTLYALPDALGRAWVVPAARHVPANAMLSALSDPSFDPAAEVLLPTSYSPLPTSYSPLPTSHSPLPAPYSLTLRDVPNGIKIHAVLEAPGYLTLADVWFPGWQAEVDGRPTELLRANYLFRAVYLEAGEHTVEMAYRPKSVLYGAVASSISLSLLVILLFLEARCKSLSLSLPTMKKRTSKPW